MDVSLFSSCIVCFVWMLQKEPSVQVGSTLSNSVEEIFTTIETLHENGHIVGMDSRFYSLVEQSYHARTVSRAWLCNVLFTLLTSPLCTSGWLHIVPCSV